MSADKTAVKRRKSVKESRAPSKRAKLNKPTPAKSTTNEPKSAVKSAPTEQTSTRSTRPKATDFFDDEPPARKATQTKRRSKNAAPESAGGNDDDDEAVPKLISRANAGRSGKKSMGLVAENSLAGFSDSDASELDAGQTEMLLAGFDSDSESKSESSDSDEEQEGISLGKLPVPTKPSVGDGKALAKGGRKGDGDEPGVLYIGRIPHGFYEHQMREYFSQFGDVTQLRLARNRRTGASKHYAFVEFASADVADIVARTMNKYLLEGHILQVRRIPKEQIHPELWKGANKRFKKMPWRDIEARGLRVPREREVWSRRVERERERREKRKKVNEEYGYEFQMADVKGVESVPSREERARRLDGLVEEEKPLLIEPNAAEPALPSEPEEVIAQDEAEQDTSAKRKRGDVRKKDQQAVSAKRAKTDASTKAKSGKKATSKS